jgi:hypothetical protein
VAAVLTGALMALALLGGGAASAATVSCAATAAGTPSASAGDPCWTEVTPYPFGFDGNPADPTSAACASEGISCYLSINSLAFRAWNRGLASVCPSGGCSAGTTPFGVWRYNGVRWYPDPTFPGTGTCPGTDILWAGDLDAWLVGGNYKGSGASPTLCHYDGVNDDWVPLTAPGGAQITSGACFAYDDCWFFGLRGAVLHWDGAELSAESTGLGGPAANASPSGWLDGTFTAATLGTDAAGNPLAFAITGDTALSQQPDGTPAPQLFASRGGAFTPAAAWSDAEPTDLVAASFDPSGSGEGWIAGSHHGPPPSTTSTGAYAPGSGGSPGSLPVQSVAGLPSSGTLAFVDSSKGGATETITYTGIAASSASTATAGTLEGVAGADAPDLKNPAGGVTLSIVEPAPLYPVDSNGSLLSCPATPQTAFTVGGGTSYSWTSIAALPGGTAVAGGRESTASGSFQPVIAQVSCSAAPQTTTFVDPSSGGQPVGPDAQITAVAASATNDVWAATNTAGNDPPELYQLTDGQTPDAPAGNDAEVRPVVETAQPTVFQFAPTVVVTPPPAPTTTTIHKAIKKIKRTLKPAIYDVSSKPVVSGPVNGVYALTISFRVRRTVTVGLEALRGKDVVSKSGLKTYRGKRGSLTVHLTRATWPTGLKFVQPATSRTKPKK